MFIIWAVLRYYFLDAVASLALGHDCQSGAIMTAKEKVEEVKEVIEVKEV